MKKLLLAIIAFGIMLGVGAVALPAPAAYASHTCDSGPRAGQPIPHDSVRAAETFCTGAIPASEAAAANANANVDCTAATLSSSNCKIYGWIVIFIRALSAMVGIVVVIMVAVGGVQYAMSKDNPQATSAAKQRIRDAMLALLIYIFMFAFLQWLIPGGVV